MNYALFVSVELAVREAEQLGYKAIFITVDAPCAPFISIVSIFLSLPLNLSFFNGLLCLVLKPLERERLISAPLPAAAPHAATKRPNAGNTDNNADEVIQLTLLAGSCVRLHADGPTT